MTRETTNDLLTAIQFQNIALNYLEYVKSQVSVGEVQFVNNLINRLKANQRECKFSIPTEKGQAAFDAEIVKADAYLYANIFVHLMECSKEQKDTIEKLVLAIHKGEMIEMVEQENKY
jgi:ribosomal protein RSM22 (predicted rRNA methylase)